MPPTDYEMECYCGEGVLFPTIEENEYECEECGSIFYGYIIKMSRGSTTYQLVALQEGPFIPEKLFVIQRVLPA